jgi:DNA-binding transcriptional LysR family regulator
MWKNLDLDLLRTLAVAREAGGFGQAARRLGRTPSAISLQMQRLEDQAGEALWRKQGRTLVPTQAGEVLLGYARRMLALNDECLGALRGGALAGTLRVGVPQDLAAAPFPAVLARFARAHPAVHIEARVDRNRALLAALDQGALDLALILSRDGRERAVHLGEVPMEWVGGRHATLPAKGAPMPLALFTDPCVFRSAALDALDGAGIPWRVSFTSPSLSGLWAAVDAGLGFTARTAIGRPQRLRLLRHRRLPGLPRVGLWMVDGATERTAAGDTLRTILRETFQPARKERATSDE